MPQSSTQVMLWCNKTNFTCAMERYILLRLKKPTLLKAYSIKHNWRDTVGNILWNFPRDTDPFKFIFNLMHFVQNTVKMKSMNAILASSRFLPHPFLQNSWLSLLSSYLQNAVPIILWRLTKLSKKKKLLLVFLPSRQTCQAWDYSFNNRDRAEFRL